MNCTTHCSVFADVPYSRREVAKTPTHDGPLPEWWVNLTDRGRRRYLARYPGSKYRNAEVRQLAESLSPEQKKGVRKFIGAVAKKGGPLAKVAEERIKVENVPAKVQPVIENLLKAANGDAAAAEKADRDLARIDAVNKPVDGKSVDGSGRVRTRGAYEILQEAKERLGRMPTSEELKTGGYSRTSTDPKPRDDGDDRPKRSGSGKLSYPSIEDQPHSAAFPSKKGDGKGAARPVDPPPADGKGKGALTPSARAQYEKRARTLALGSLGMLVIGAAVLATGAVPVGVFTPELINAVMTGYQRRRASVDREARDLEGKGEMPDRRGLHLKESDKKRGLLTEYLREIKAAFMEGFNERAVEDSLMVTKRGGKAAPGSAKA